MIRNREPSGTEASCSVLAARARRLAAPVSSAPDQGEAEGLVFRIGAAVWAIETRFVLSVSPRLRVTALPRPVAGFLAVTLVGVDVLGVLRLGGTARDASVPGVHVLLGERRPALVLDVDDVAGVRRLRGITAAREIDTTSLRNETGALVRATLLEGDIALLDGAALLRVRGGGGAAGSPSQTPASQTPTR